MKKRVFYIILSVILAISSCAFAHAGRTDSSGGHKDNQNKSGLGSYHYHCGGHPAHLHSGGVCPYSSKSAPKKTAAPKSTPKPTAAPKSTPQPASATLPITAGAAGSSPSQAAALAASLSTIPLELMPLEGALLFGKTKLAEVNLRQSSTTKSKKLGEIKKKGTLFEIIELIADNPDELWYKIWYNENVCYVMEKYVDLVPAEEYLGGK